MSLDLGTVQATLVTKGIETFNKQMKNADTNLSTFSDKLGTAGKKFTDTGKNLSLKLTAPILAAAGAALKLASDFEVAQKRTAGAFKGMDKEVNGVLENLNTNFGVANTKATELIGIAGNLRKGFGDTSENALTFSEDMLELAAALSATSGIPIEDVFEKLNKGTLGERDGLVSLGIKISEIAIQEELLLQGKENLTGTALTLAKGEATLKLAYEQSSDAVRNFSDNQNTLASQSQKVLGEMEDLAIELGTILIPIAKDVVEAVSNMIGKFSDLTDEQKTTIIKIATVTAAIGPLLIGLGSTAVAIGRVSIALKFLAANPVLLAVAGIAAVTTALVLLVEKKKQDNLDSLIEKFGELGEQAGLTGDDFDEFITTLGEVENQLAKPYLGSSLEEVRKIINIMSQKLGITVDQIIEMGLKSDKVTEATKRTLEVIKDQYDNEDEINKKLLDQALSSGAVKDITEDIVVIKEGQLETEEDITEEMQAQLDLEEENLKSKEELATAITAIDLQSKAGYISEASALENKINLRQAIIDKILLESQAAGTFGDDEKKRINTQQVEIDRYYARLEVLTSNQDALEKTLAEAKVLADKEAAEAKVLAEEEAAEATLDSVTYASDGSTIIEDGLDEHRKSRRKKRITDDKNAAADEIELEQDTADSIVEITSDSADKKRKIVDKTIEEQIASNLSLLAEIALALDEDVEAHQEAYVQKAKTTEQWAIDNGEKFEENSENLTAGLERDTETIKEHYDTILGFLEEHYDAITDFASYAAGAITTISDQRIANLVSEQETFETYHGRELDRLQEKRDSGEILTDSEIDRYETLIDAERNFQIEIYKEEKKAFMISKAFKIADAVSTGANAAINAYNSLVGIPYVGVVLAVAGVAAAIAFTGAQIALIAKQQPPPPPFKEGGIVTKGMQAIVGEAGPEAILPLTDNTFKAIGQSIVDAQSGSASSRNSGFGNLTIILPGFGETSIRLTQTALDNGQITIPATAFAS